MSVLDQLSERHIECFRSILGKLFSVNSITKINLKLSRTSTTSTGEFVQHVSNGEEETIADCLKRMKKIIFI